MYDRFKKKIQITDFFFVFMLLVIDFTSTCILAPNKRGKLLFLDFVGFFYILPILLYMSNKKLTDKDTDQNECNFL